MIIVYKPHKKHIKINKKLNKNDVYMIYNSSYTHLIQIVCKPCYFKNALKSTYKSFGNHVQIQYKSYENGQITVNKLSKNQIDIIHTLLLMDMIHEPQAHTHSAHVQQPHTYSSRSIAI